MKPTRQKRTRAEEKILIAKMVSQCRERAAVLMKGWSVIDKSWPIKKGSAYIRLSTEDQVLVDGGSLEQQVNLAFEEAVIRSKEDQINYQITEIFIDAGISGQTNERAELQRLDAKIQKSGVAFVIVKDPARVFRHADFFAGFFERCNKAGCEIMFKGLPMNPNDPNDVLRLRMLAAFAEYEARNTSKRVRENVYAAMEYNGKFNATHKVLGLDQLTVNGTSLVGLYSPNKDELAIVEWIMQTFVKMGSYQVTLAEIERRGIKNKNGNAFQKNSLYGLLTNKKYIGKWELNVENKDKDPRKLMPYERHKIVDLPHGCVIDLNLWERVQATVQRLKGSKAKNMRLQRVYLLSGLLKYGPDGSAFGGSGNWGSTQRVNYYQNTKHRIRLLAEAIELEARKVVSEIIKQSPKLREAIIERTKSMRSSLDLLQGQLQQLDMQITKLQSDRNALDKRLDFLLSTEDSTQAEVFRQEYLTTSSKIKSEIEACHKQKAVIELSKVDLKDDDLNMKSLIERADKIQAMILEKDPVALKNAYKALFSEIEVSELDKNGQRQLRFKICGDEGKKKASPFWGLAEPFGIDNKMAHQFSPITLVASAKDLSMISTVQVTPLYENEEFLRDRYLLKQLSTRQIAAEIRSARSTVKEAIRRLKIPMRPEDEARKLSKGQLAYGERLVQGKIVPHKAEQKVIQEILKRHRFGSSYSMIADWLNSKGVPTKNNANSWQRPTVYKIIRQKSG